MTQTKIQFKTQELQKDGSFRVAEYQFKGNEGDGWDISRNGEPYLQLGSGYVLIETRCCGVCSTDLARRFLPFPLPQVIGHEVVGLFNDKPVVIEINASHKARGLRDTDCSFCSNGMDIHCPERLTLGINRLPGGFAPYLLAPRHAIRPIPNNMSIMAASLTEPFAAALQGVDATSPKVGDTVAVLGPRRLGMLVIAALAAFRQETGQDFKITGIVRHARLEKQCRLLGADDVVNLANTPLEELKQSFDVVYDTTGTPGGFASALQLSRRVVHLKSTHGQAVLGLNYLTELVVDEIALLPFGKEVLFYHWSKEKKRRENRNILVSPTVSDSIQSQAKLFHPEATFHRMNLKAAWEKIRKNTDFLASSPFPRFDLAIVSELQEVDQVIRPDPREDMASLRPRGAVLLALSNNAVSESVLSQAIKKRRIEIHSSRCGNFERALKLLQENREIAESLEKALITHKYPLGEIDEAFQMASNSTQSIKVVVETAAR